MKVKIELTKEEVRGLYALDERKVQKSHKRIKSLYGEGEYCINSDDNSIIELDISTVFLMSVGGLLKTIYTSGTSFMNTWFSPSTVTVEDLTEENKKEEQVEEEPILQKHPLKGCKDILDEIQDNNKNIILNNKEE